MEKTIYVQVPWSLSVVEVSEQPNGLFKVRGPMLWDDDLTFDVAMEWIEREVVKFNGFNAQFICSCGNDWPCWDSVAPGWDTDFHHQRNRNG